MLDLKIVNVVSTADLQQSVDLIQISQIEHTIYDSEIYGGRVVYLKTPEMYGKVSIFSSGKLISVGSKSPKQAEEDLISTSAKLIEHELIKQVDFSVKVRNIVAVLNLSIIIDLEELSIRLDGIYEPEQFPGMIIRQETPKVTYLVFSSGKVVITGSTSSRDLQQAALVIKKDIQDIG